MAMAMNRKPRLTAPIQLCEGRQLELEQILEDFKMECLNNTDAQDYMFPDTLSNEERRFIHLKAQQMGFITKSVGKEPHRSVTVKKRTGNTEASEVLSLAAESMTLISNILQTHRSNSSSSQNGLRRNDEQTKRQRGSSMKVPPPLKECKEHRAALPIWKLRTNILAAVRDSKSPVLVKGGTGSGKSTQVPQYLLEDAAERNEKVNIICTMPRRVAAISICDRVAFERDEEVGRTVGYKIRLETTASAETVLTFCTPGVLLRSFSDPSYLHGITHLILDEVHERDMFTDFIFGYLKQESRKLQHLRIIVMSADIDVQVFADFFDTFSLIKVEGTMFPVSVLYLSDVLRLIEFKVSTPDSCVRSPKKQKALHHYRQTTDRCQEEVHDLLNEILISEDEFAAGRLVKLVAAGKVHVDYYDPKLDVTILGACASRFMVRPVHELMCLGADLNAESRGWKTKDLINMLDAQLVERFEMQMMSADNDEDPLVTSYIKTVDIERVDNLLIFKLIKHIHTTNSDFQHGILVFLPGFEDIITLKNLICRGEFADPNSFRLYLLHSTIEADQRNVFKKVPVGVRKIILSTNIAETSLTVEGVVYVIDSGKVKEKSYDSQTHCSMLRSTWISKASANQRKGRAGRVCPGVCYRLYTQKRFSAMDEFQLSEIVRSSLQELCLHSKSFLPKGAGIAHFFTNLPEPPPDISVKNALKALKFMNALASDEQLTDLGRILVHFPMEPCLSKTLVYSVIFRCLDPIVAIIATLCYRSPFQTFDGNADKTRAFAAKKELSGGSYSDHIGMSKAFEGWHSEHNRPNQRRFCEKYMLSNSTLQLISGIRRQLLDILSATCLKMYRNTEWNYFNTNSKNMSVIRAVLTAGLYPNICKLAQSKAYLFNKIDQKIRFHFHSTLSTGTNSTVLSLPSDWVIYGEMARNSTSCSILECSMVSPITIALFAGLDSHQDEIVEDEGGMSTLRISDWISFRGTKSTIQGIQGLRNQWKILSQEFFISGKLSEVHGDLLSCTVKVLTTEDVLRKSREQDERKHNSGHGFKNKHSFVKQSQ